MTRSLFLEHNLTFEKTAMTVKLSDNPDNWQREIASEVYKQLPYLADYSVNVMLDRVDPQRGYAFGSAEVSNKTDSPLSEQPTSSVRVPLLVKDRLLQPLDIMLDGSEALPLNERRLREKLFRTAAFETSTRNTSDQGMVDQLYPPTRSNYGGDAGSSGAGFGKQAQVFGSHVPSTVDHASIPYEHRRKDYQSYLKEKAVEPATGYAKSMGVGGVTGAGLGALAGLGGGGAKGGLVGAAIGGAAGLGIGALAAHSDKNNIEHAQKTLKNRNVDGALASTIASRARAKETSEFMNAERRHQELMGAMKTASLCEAIAPTISVSQYESFRDRVLGDENLKIAAYQNGAFARSTETILTANITPVEKTAEALVQNIRPTVVQLTKLASGNFRVKWANAGAFQPQQAEVDPQQAAAMAGPETTQMAPGATMTVSTERAKKETLDEPSGHPINDFGDYVVKNADSGESLSGTVMPVIDFEMHPMPLYLFTDGGGNYALQDEILGIRTGDGGQALQNVHGAPPQGDGVFFYVPAQGKPFCTLPLSIQNGAADPSGMQSFMGETVFGEKVELILTPGIMALEPIGDGKIAIPDDMQWLPLGGQAVHLLKPDEPDAHAEQAQMGGQVNMKSTGGEMSMDGMPLSKVARDQKWFLKKAEAEFLLVGMGLTQQEARDAMKQADVAGQVKLAGLRHITPLADFHAEMTKKAAALLEQFDYSFWRRDLVKEAAVLEDSETADKILAMNFVNPENVSIFANYLPELDAASAKLAEMLFAARLGMNQVPEDAAERAMKNLEEVIQGLRALQQKELL